MYTASFLQDPDFIRSLYIVAFVLFIVDLRLMNHPRTARKGNVIGAIGMGIAAVIIGLSDNFFRPLVQSREGGMHTLMAMLGIFG